MIELAKKIAKSKPTIDIYNKFSGNIRKKNYVSKICNMFRFDEMADGKSKMDLNCEREYLLFQMILRKHKYKRTPGEMEIVENTIDNLHFFQ